MSVFDDTRLPVDVENGATGGPGWSTTIVTLGSGYEQRNEMWKYARHVYNIAYGIRLLGDIAPVRSFFYARRGQSRAFRFRDWSDCLAQDTVVPTNGLTGACVIPLAKTYDDDVGPYSRPITRVNYTNIGLSCKVDGTPVSVASESCGLMSFTSLPAGVLTATYEFDVPVRFSVDDFNLTVTNILAGEIDSLTLIEVIENAYTLNGLDVPL